MKRGIRRIKMTNEVKGMIQRMKDTLNGQDFNVEEVGFCDYGNERYVNIPTFQTNNNLKEGSKEFGVAHYQVTDTSGMGVNFEGEYLIHYYPYEGCYADEDFRVRLHLVKSEDAILEWVSNHIKRGDFRNGGMRYGMNLTKDEALLMLKTEWVDHFHNGSRLIGGKYSPIQIENNEEVLDMGEHLLQDGSKIVVEYWTGAGFKYTHHSYDQSRIATGV